MRSIFSVSIAALTAASILGITAGPAMADAGSVDTDFLAAVGAGPVNADAPATTPQGSVYVTAQRADGQFLVGGLFKNWDGTLNKYLALLDADGSLDTSLTGAAGHSVADLIVQPDGKVLLSGSFRDWGGTAPRGITRINADGTLDSAFAANAGSGWGNSGSAVALQADGKVLSGSSSTTWSGTTTGTLVRLDSDGQLDGSFDTTIGGGGVGTVRAITVQSDGSILAGGALNSWNGTTVGRLARLSSTGALDTSFNTAIGLGADGDVYKINELSDGSLLIGGDFTTWDTTAGVGRVVKLRSSGALDTDFTANVGTGANARLADVVPLSAGGYLVMGRLTDWNGTSVGYLVALNDDGTVDEALTDSFGTGANGYVYHVNELADGDLLIGGSFTSWNGTAAPGLVRISSGGAGGTGTVTSSDPSGGVPPVLQQFILPAEQRADADACATSAPSYVVDDRTTTSQRFEGWSMSYAEWPHAGSGGWVCTRTLTYRASSDVWIAGPSSITGSGELQQYAIPSVVDLRDSADTTDAQIRAQYCRANAPDDPALGATWGARNEGWRPTYAEWVDGGRGGWVCSRTV